MRAVAISSDGLLISNGSDDNLGHEIIVRDIKTTKPVVQLKGHAGEIYGLAFSRDGKTLVSGSGDKSVKVWQLYD
ncbi:MAG: hypothetical protein IGS39_24065 [Calothrix sp. C42_A2020_038]|nr:hypothetical protein [Calothrix sp. C42_A2020_038]